MEIKDAFGYSEKIPEDIREIFVWLCQDLASLQDKWRFYTDLFSSEENTSLLSEIALSSFRIIEESLRNDMTLAICRLSDPALSSGKANLSIRTLTQNYSTMEIIKNLENDFIIACQPIRELRNKNVGHNDLNTRIEPIDNPLPGIKKSQIFNIIDLAEKILKSIFEIYDRDSELGFSVPIQIGGDDDLIYWLKKAKAENFNNNLSSDENDQS